eukprot:Clim_evm12s240 gene=Clim_evmTU12s240
MLTVSRHAVGGTLLRASSQQLRRSPAMMFLATITTQKGKSAAFPVQSNNGADQGVGWRLETDKNLDYNFFIDPPQGVEIPPGAREAAVWASEHPMTLTATGVEIGNFRLPVDDAEATASHAEKPPVSDQDWFLINLPTNRKIVYNTLKAFSMGQHVLYSGETGTGKTWIARKISQMLGRDLYMVSLNEYTKNEDLTTRNTFGEESEGKTAVSKATVLQWMENGGVLLLDEMHKPLEGVSVLNNILQYGEFRMSHGAVIKQKDSILCSCIATMNPPRPPYRGESPSGELASRFGITLEVPFLPPAEEEALLSCFMSPEHGANGRPLSRTLVSIATELRANYPTTIPLPLSTRSLINVARHIEAFPEDNPEEIFLMTFNPCTVVEDLTVRKAIHKVLEAHDLANRGANALAGHASRQAAATAGATGGMSRMDQKMMESERKNKGLLNQFQVKDNEPQFF